MLFSGMSLRPAYFAISALALSLAACGGASSDEPTSTGSANTETTENTGTGALADMAIGSADAPVTVIEFASVTCPHCATFHEQIFPSIKENYIDTGKVRFIFRAFPTAPAELSIVGSMLARCAADKGGSEAYFLLTKALFLNQGDYQKGTGWIYGDSPRDELIKITSQVGMTEADFETCVKRKELLELINQNINTAQETYKINSTPSFVIDGQLRNISSVEGFSKALDEALENAEKTAAE